MRAVALRRRYKHWWHFRGTLAVLALLVLFVGVAAFSVSLHRPTETVTLPVEVIGPNGTTKAVTVEASDVSSVQELYLRAHSIGYPDHVIEEHGYQVDKASIRINGGPWVDVNNRVASCEEPEESIGCITGPYHTIRFAIPISEFGGVRSGSNTIEFRFNYASPDVSTGYRILGIELRTTSGRDAIDGTTFVWDDPAEWTPPSGYDTSGDIAAGKKLWHEQDFLVDGWDGPSIKAACADCHANNGRDLQYFAYSNESVVQRSRFHGLSEEEGKQIAAYIRSIELKTKSGKKYDPPGRPWEPPYQPGPTALASREEGDPRTAGKPFEEIDQQFWAAGAGLDWALDDDSETYPYLFPNGISFDDVAVDEVAEEAGVEERPLNMRTLPLALQMPDWNEWLPKVHPMDAYGSDFRNGLSGGGQCQNSRTDAWNYYNDEVRPLDGSSGNKKVENTLNAFASKVNSFRKCKKHTSLADYHEGDAKISVHAWGAVKEWEVLHTYSYEDISGKRHSDGEELGWGGDQRVIFNMAPHIVEGDESMDEPKGDRDGVTDWYYDTAWYQHQLTLNPGHSLYTGAKPVDWKYHFQHVLGYQGTSGQRQDVRYMASYLKLLQSAELAPDNNDMPDVPEGWYIKHVTPAWIVRPGKHYLSGMNQVVDNGECHANSLLAKFFIDGMTPEDESKWTRTTDAQGISPEDHSPRYLSSLNQNHPTADQLYTATQLFSERGVPAEILRPLADWGEAMWPGSDWHQLIDENAECGSLGTIADENPDNDDDPEDDDLEDDGPNHDNDGLKYEYYEGQWSSLPNFNQLSAETEGTVNNFDISVAERDDNFAIRFTGYLDVSSSGTYEFYTTSDDGSRLLIDGREVVDNDGLHAAQEASGSITLSEGFHPITVEFFERGGGEKLEVSWSGPDFSKQQIPDDHLSQAAGQTITLQEGWNLISTRIAPSEAQMDSIFSEVVDDVMLVKDEAGDTYVPEYGINTIGEWNPLEAYMVYATSPFKLSFEGSALPAEDTPIELEPGWNLVSYLPRAAISAEEAFSSLGSKLVVVKDYAGRVYIPEHEVNAIGKARPGFGYRIYVSDETTLTYPASTESTSNLQNQATSSAEELPSSGVPASATILTRAASLKDGTLISAQNADGELMGQGTVQNGVAAVTIRGDEGTTSNVLEGAKEGERITLKAQLTSDIEDKLSIVSATDVLSGESVSGSLRYTNDALLVAEVKAAKPFRLAENYPNPFSTSTTIEYELLEKTPVKLEVYDALGRRVALLVDEDQEAGNYKVSFDAARVSSGIYFYRMRAGDEAETHKMTIVR